MKKYKKQNIQVKIPISETTFTVSQKIRQCTIIMSELEVTSVEIIKYEMQRGGKKVLKFINRVTVACGIISSCLPYIKLRDKEDRE